MFTGIVEELGTVRAVDRVPAGARLEVASTKVLADAAVGCSVSVDGVCLTAVGITSDSWFADVVPETLARTTLGRLEPGDRVNLERPLRADGRLGGHVVLGHVDATIEIVAIVDLPGGATEMTLELPESLAPYVVEKGSVALDGVSLTVARLSSGRFGVALIPHTLAVTTLGRRQPGDPVNFEADYLAKVVVHATAPYAELSR